MALGDIFVILGGYQFSWEIGWKFQCFFGDFEVGLLGAD